MVLASATAMAPPWAPLEVPPLVPMAWSFADGCSWMAG